MRLNAVAVLALFASLALPLLEVSAQDGPEWPMYRADPQHTGACASAVPASLDGPLAVRLGQSALTSPASAGGRVFVASADGTLYAVWADNGAVAWSRSLGQKISAEPAVDGGTVYAVTEPGRLWALDAARGTPLWDRSLPTNLTFNLPLVFSNGSILVSASPGAVLRINAAGEHALMWQAYLGGALKGPVTVGGGLVYVVLSGGNATALDLETGIRRWSLGPGTGSSNEFPSAYLDGRLYIGTRGRDVFCVDTSNGSLVWSTTLKSTISGAPAIGGGRIILGTENGQVHALNLSDGGMAWPAPFDAAPDARATPALAGDAVLLGDGKGGLFVLDAASGSLRGSLTLPAGRYSQPVPSEGRILAASADGSLFIVGPASASPAATLEASPARASTGEEVVFTAQNFSSPAGLAYGGMRVDFGDGRSSAWTAGARIGHSYSKKGLYEATLTVKDSAGTGSHPVYARVDVFNDLPSVVLDIPPSCIAGSPAAMGAGASDPDGRVALYEWDFEGDGTFDWSGPSMPEGFNHTYTLNGTYHPTVRVQDDNGSYAQASGELSVLPAPVRTPTPQTGPLPLPAAAASVSLVSLAAVGAGISLTDFGKYRFFTLFIVPLYVRLKKDHVLDHFLRGQIYGYIKANPGDNYNSIRDVLKLSNGIVAHHLHTLEREGLVQSMRDGMYRRFWPADAKLPPEDEGHFNIQKRIVAIIGDNPGISQKEIAQKVGVSSPTVNYHIRVLETARMIHVKKLGRRTGCYVVEDQPHT